MCRGRDGVDAFGKQGRRPVPLSSPATPLPCPAEEGGVETDRMRRPGLTLILPIIAIGVIATAVAVLNRGGDPEFVFRQENLTALTPAVLEHFVASAPDPRPGMGRHRGIRARCSAQGAGELRNPWVCTVKYPVGPSVRYRVVIAPTGQVNGSSRDGSLVIYGCCLGFRAAQ